VSVRMKGEELLEADFYRGTYRTLKDEERHSFFISNPAERDFTIRDILVRVSDWLAEFDSDAYCDSIEEIRDEGFCIVLK